MRFFRKLIAKRFFAAMFLGFVLQPTPQASELQQLFGEWGTETQCARGLITPKGTRYAAPFKISADWLGHGDVWCRLNWRTVDPAANGMVAFVHALCGEDTVRDYQLKFELDGDELSLIWNVFHKNGPLKRCEH